MEDGLGTSGTVCMGSDINDAMRQVERVKIQASSLVLFPRSALTSSRNSNGFILSGIGVREKELNPDTLNWCSCVFNK